MKSFRLDRWRHRWLLGFVLVFALGSCQLFSDVSRSPGVTQAVEPPAQATTPSVLPATRVPTSGAPAATPGSEVSGDEQLPGDGDPSVAMLPEARNDLARLENVPRYRIALDVDPDAVHFRGISGVTYTNTENVPLDEVYFRLLPNGQKSYGNGSLAVSAVRIAGQPAETQLSDSDTVLKVKLPARLEPGGQTTFELAFDGVVPVDFGGNDEPAGYGIYNFSENVLALSGWYPILAVYDAQGWNLDPVSAMGDSVYSDMALYSVRACLASDWVVAATGVVVDRQAGGDLTCQQFESGPARDFFLIASPDFELLSKDVDGTKVNAYYLPNHQEPAEQALQISADSLHIFNQQFGAYPNTELDVVDAPMRNALGVEYPGIVLVASQLYDTPDDPSFAVATAHEVAHQWWYNIVGNDVFDEPWLDEALTTYSSSLYYEFGPDAGYAQGLRDYWQQRYEKLRQDGKDDRISEPLTYFEDLGDARVYSGVVYTKGALFFDALRKEIGDQAFFGALAQYYQSRKYQVARAEDLLNTFEATAGRSLDDFYQQWLYSR